MVITCMKKGLGPDFSLCYPEGNDIVMVINEDVELVFHNIYSCQKESIFNFSKFLEDTSNGSDGLSKNNLDNRLSYFNRHKKSIINRFESGTLDSIFFDSIELESLAEYFNFNKLSCYLSIRCKNKDISLNKLKELNKSTFYKVANILRAYNVCQIVSIDDYEKLKNNLLIKRLDAKSFIIGSIVSLIVPAIIFLIMKED